MDQGTKDPGTRDQGPGTKGSFRGPHTPLRKARWRIYSIIIFYIAPRPRLQQELDKCSAGSADSPPCTCFRLEAIYVYVEVHGMKIHVMAHNMSICMIVFIIVCLSICLSVWVYKVYMQMPCYVFLFEINIERIITDESPERKAKNDSMWIWMWRYWWCWSWCCSGVRGE